MTSPLEAFANLHAVPVTDETGFLKQGHTSRGVARQYTGSAGKITNCRIGVFIACVSRHGRAFFNLALPPPKARTDSSEQRRKAHPQEPGFVPKPVIASA